MYITRHWTGREERWALGGRLLPRAFSLSLLLQVEPSEIGAFLGGFSLGDDVSGSELLAPLEAEHEVWAAGVTYQRSREARMEESGTSDVYARVYDAERPELFFKAIGKRVVGDGGNIRVRRDASWNVPEPEMCIVLNAAMQAVGYCAGNDVSSRDIEGENPLYLPQAKVYEGSCALGPGVVVTEGLDGAFESLEVRLVISRNGERIFDHTVDTSSMKRKPYELAAYLGRELKFDDGVFLMTGTGLVPPDDLTLIEGDEVRVRVGEIELFNRVSR